MPAAAGCRVRGRGSGWGTPSPLLPALHEPQPWTPHHPTRCAGKFGGLFASLPPPLVSGLFCIMFGLIAAGEHSEGCAGGFSVRGGCSRIQIAAPRAGHDRQRRCLARSAGLLRCPPPPSLPFATHFTPPPPPPPPANLAVGLSMMVHADQRSDRNIFIGGAEAGVRGWGDGDEADGWAVEFAAARAEFRDLQSGSCAHPYTHQPLTSPRDAPLSSKPPIHPTMQSVLACTCPSAWRNTSPTTPPSTGAGPSTAAAAWWTTCSSAHGAGRGGGRRSGASVPF